MNILSNLDIQIINYFLNQFKTIGNMFYLTPIDGAIIYISTIGYIISCTLPNKSVIKPKRNKLWL